MTSSNDTLAKIEAMATALAHDPGKAKTAMQREYLELIGHFLADQGRGDVLAFPLLDLIELLDSGGVATSLPPPPERRTRLVECSDEVLAKASAVVDVLVNSGYSSDHACQIVTRQLIARNIQVPAGGDARGWRNLQAWRHKLINASRQDTPVHRVYAAFKEELPKVYGSKLAEAAARDAIWDRRSRRPGESQ